MPTNPLTDAIAPRHRTYVYAAAFVVQLGLSAWLAANGDVRAAVVPFVTALTSALSYSNVNR